MIRGALVLLLASGCTPEVEDPLRVPRGFPDPIVPEDNPITAEKVELGRHLFYDVRLSGNGTQACGTCHIQEHGFATTDPVGVGSTGQHHVRNPNSLVNVAYNATLTWANPNLVTLETQILVPLFGDAPVEMGATDESLARIAGDPLYEDLFDDAFPGEDIGWDQVARAVSSFTRTMISGGSPFDRYAYYGEDTLTQQQIDGMGLFFSEQLECHHCHGGFNFSEASVHVDQQFDSASFQNTGLYNVDGLGGYPANNPGLYEITGDWNDMGRFRAPSLRNVTETAPYMHDGTVQTLEEVVRLYEAGGRVITEGPYAGDGTVSPLKSGFVPGFSITDDERAALIAFLESLTDDDFLTDPRFADPFAE